MAKSPKSQLQISFVIDSKGLTTGMNRVTSQTGRMAKSADRGARSTAALGSALKTAAIAAGGAALAYVSVAQAKAAIQTTQDLALATAGLNRNLGIATVEASRWAAVTRARGIDSKTLTMSFTSVARALEGVKTGSESARAPFEALGISQKELTATGGNFTKQILLIADGLGKAEGSSTRQAAAQKLLGRGYRDLLPMFTEGSKGLQEQLRWADEFGATLGKDTVGAMADFTTAQRKTKVAMMGLQITFAKYATPAITDALGWVQKFVKVLNDPSLSKADRLSAVRKQFRDLADDVLGVLSDLGPEIAQAAGQLGVIMARSIAKAFVETGFLGKIAIGALVIRSFGGPAAIIAAGRGVGALLSAGMAQGTAAAGTFGLARSFGRGRSASAFAAVGSTAAAATAGGFAKSLAKFIPGAMAVVAVGDIALTALAGDMKGAAIKGGGALIGGVLGAFFPPAGIAIGAGLGVIGADLISGIVGGAEKEAPRLGEQIAQIVERLGKAAEREKGSYLRLSSASKFLVDSRRQQKTASERVIEAEARLARVRRASGPNSVAAIQAERRLASAKNAVTRATIKAKNAERTYGVERTATKVILRESVTDQKAELFNLRAKQNRLSAVITSTRFANLSGERQLEISRAYTQVSRSVERGQGSLNRSYLEAAQRVGPKFANSLQRISGRAESLRRNVGKLQTGISLNTREMSQAYRNALDRMLRKTADATEVLRSDGQISVIPTGPGGESGAVPRRRGGSIMGGNGRSVTAAVSPGEMITHRGREVMVPGRPEARDSVLMNLPVGSKVFTSDGQARLAMGASHAQALRDQAPHFVDGGLVRPQMVGGIPGPRRVANRGFGIVHKQANAYIRRNSLSDLAGAERLARKFGLDVSSGYRPGDDGYHGVNRARDFAGDPSEMYRFAKYVGTNFESKLLELIYSPLGWSIDNYRRVAPYAVADHYDHVHLAMRNGGRVSAGRSPMRKKTQWGPDQLHTLAAAVGMPNPGLMAQIAQGESGGNAKLDNTGLNPDGSVDYGLWQINSVHGKPVSGMLNPIQNALYAKEILRSQGLGAWVAYSNGRYSQFSGGKYDPEFYWDLIYSDKAQDGAVRGSKKRRNRGLALGKKLGRTGGSAGTRERVRLAIKNGKKAVRLAKTGNVGGARKFAGKSKKFASLAAADLRGSTPRDNSGGRTGTTAPISDVSYLSLPPSIRKSLSFEDRAALLERDLAVAATTATGADDEKVLNAQIRLFRGLRKRSSKTIAETSAKLLGFTPAVLTRARNKANSKGKSAAARRRRREGRATLATYTALQGKRSTAIADLGRAESGITEAQSAKAEGAAATANADLATAMAELSTAIREQNEIAKGVQATSSREAFRMLSDVISGQIVGKRLASTPTPQGVRY